MWMCWQNQKTEANISSRSSWTVILRKFNLSTEYKRCQVVFNRLNELTWLNRLLLLNSYVDVIHTDNVLGYSSPLGHKDFYPNGGSTQLGCMTLIRKRAVQKSSKDWYPIVHAILSSQLGCSHERSIHYYAESVNSNCRFKSSLCTNLGIFIFDPFC